MARVVSRHRLGPHRDPQVDEKVLTVTRQLLAEQGYRGTSIESIAREAGVSRTAVYRRWPSKAHVVYEAVFPSTNGEPAAMADDPREEMAHAVASVVAFISRPAARQALPGLMSDLEVLTGTQSAFATSDLKRISAGLAALIDSHPEVFRHVDADTVLDTIIGSALHACCVRGVTDADSYTRSLTDMLFNGLLKT